MNSLNHPDDESLPGKARFGAAVVTLAYLVFGVVYLAFTQWLLRTNGWNSPHGMVITRLLFLVISGGMIAVLVHRQLRRRYDVEGRERGLRLEEQRARLGAEHARGHVALQAKAGEVLAGALVDADGPLGELASAIAPDFGDIAVVVGVEGERARVLGTAAAEPDAQLRLATFAGDDAWLAAAMAAAKRRPVLLKELSVDDPDPLPASLAALGATSAVISPVSVDGVPAGLLVAATLPGRRGYRPSDLDALWAVATRAAAVVDRVALHGSVLREQSRLAAIVASSPIGLLELDLAGTVITMNEAARQMLGFEDEVAMTDLRAWISGARERVLAGEAVQGDVLSTRRPDGTPLELSVSAAPIGGGPHGPDHLLVVLSDVTEARRLQQQVEQNQRLDALGRMAGAVAHDYNNLLTVILGYTELVLGRLADDDPSKADLQSVYRASEQARALADQLLTLSRRSVVRPEVIDPAAAVDSLAEVVRRLAGPNVTIDLSVDPAAGFVLIDPGQLNQVLLNLVINAVDAMPDGGRLEVRVSNDPQADAVALRVTDTGTGMAAGVLERCMEPFFTTKRRSGGTGLGLATVHAIVSQAGGDLSVYSDPGKGTTCIVRFPHADGRGVTAPVDDEDAVDGEGSILLVEDEDAVRAFAATVLRSAGFAVTEAASGREALVHVEEQGDSFDLVVTDVVMPGMTGVELARRIEELQPDLPVLFVSGFAEDPLLHGPNGVRVPFVSKPYRPDVLLHAVRHALDAPTPAQSWSA